MEEARYISLRHAGKSAAAAQTTMDITDRKRERLEGHYRAACRIEPDNGIPNERINDGYVALILRARPWGFVQPRDVVLTRAGI